jgi:hypothetical protein
LKAMRSKKGAAKLAARWMVGVLRRTARALDPGRPFPPAIRSRPAGPPGWFHGGPDQCPSGRRILRRYAVHYPGRPERICGDGETFVDRSAHRMVNRDYCVGARGGVEAIATERPSFSIRRKLALVVVAKRRDSASAARTGEDDASRIPIWPSTHRPRPGLGHWGMNRPRRRL